jgi:hypothetical protein
MDVYDLIDLVLVRMVKAYPGAFMYDIVWYCLDMGKYQYIALQVKSRAVWNKKLI